MSCVLEFQNHMRRLIRDAENDLIASQGTGEMDKIDKTIIHGILRCNLPKAELEMDILKDHAVSLIGAGIASAQWTLMIACFHVIADKRVGGMLKRELETAMPDPSAAVPFHQIAEKCPYLVACVEEGMCYLLIFL